jgi:hypothetical protein
MGFCIGQNGAGEGIHGGRLRGAGPEAKAGSEGCYGAPYGGSKAGGNGRAIQGSIRRSPVIGRWPVCYNPAMSKALPFDRDAARQDIERRNQLRAESHLPVLDIDSELKRLAQVHNGSEFEQFIDSPHCTTEQCGAGTDIQNGITARFTSSLTAWSFRIVFGGGWRSGVRT